VSRPEHERLQQEELKDTSVSHGLARLLSLGFLVAVMSVPLAQIAVEALRGERIQAVDVFLTTPTRESLHTYEKDLAQRSIVRKNVQPWGQELLTRVFSAGSEQVIIGRDRWLFYRTGIEYAAGPGFLQIDTLYRRSKQMSDHEGNSDPHPDPRAAIIAFQHECARNNIHLVVMPVPDKATMQPAQLSPRFGTAGMSPVHNRDYDKFIQFLRGEGVDVLDPTPGTIQPEENCYLRGDTHWTPEFMDATAQKLSAHIQKSTTLPPSTTSYTLEQDSAENSGDLMAMLKLPTPFAPEKITIQRVIDEATHEAIVPQKTADVLLLGDSFVNIFSLDTLEWGHGAGFGEHLSFHLKRPLDTIAFNGGGAYEVRAEIARPENRARFLGKKVIVYQFSARDLSSKDWKPVSFSEAAVDSSASTQPIIADVEILKTSNVPTPGSVPYRDCLTFIKVKVLRVDSGQYAKPDLIAVFVAMRDNQLLPAARYAAGDRLKLKLIPLLKADSKTQSLQRADNLDDFTLVPYFATEEKSQ
jgi:hypothetical protein